MEQIFTCILFEVEAVGYLNLEEVFVEGMKINANLKKKVKNLIPRAAKIYDKHQEASVKKSFDGSKTTEGTGDKGIDCGSRKRGFL